jgi:AraC-like DNA-binding protein
MTRTRGSSTPNHVPDGEVVSGMPKLRISAAWGLPGLLSELGVPLESVLADVDLPPQLFSSRENVLTYRQLESLLLACERRTECDYIGLLVGQRSRLVDMGLAGEVALCEPTAGAGLRTFIEHFNLHDTAATVALLDQGTLSKFVYAISEHGLNDTRHFQQAGITIACNILQDLCGPDWLPAEVRFASRSPSSLRPFQKFFRAPVQFDADESAVIFSRKWLDRDLPALDEATRRKVRADVQAQRAQVIEDLPATLRRLLRKQLLLGNFTMPDIAAQLSMHRRTLDRHLQRSGIVYGELVESVKEDVARQLLRDTRMPIQRIAETVRFSSAANFATAFRRRVGVTPSEYRRGS